MPQLMKHPFLNIIFSGGTPDSRLQTADCRLPTDLELLQSAEEERSFDLCVFIAVAAVYGIFANGSGI